MSKTRKRLAKVRLSILMRLFFVYSFVLSLIFCIFQNEGHFRTARERERLSQKQVRRDLRPRGMGFVYLKIES